MSRSVVIVGSGPGGMYAAQGVLGKAPDCRIDIIERLPSPYGLIRGGVAPDHQSTKNVSRAFEKTMTSEGVRYLGNVEVGRDVSLAELEEIYDAVVLAYGAPHDNRLVIPGEDKQNVFGSNAFVGWYNCHPDFRDLDPELDIKAASVVGVGNVAIDVARVLAKTHEEMSVTDLAPYADAAIQASPIEDIYVFGRRGPVEAAFTNVEFRELGELQNCLPVIDPAQIPDEVTSSYLSERDLRVREKNVATMRAFPQVSADGKAKRMHLRFYASPVEILGGDRVEGIVMEKTRVDENGKCIGTGETFEVPCGMIVTCIGSRAAPVDDEPFDDRKGIVIHENGLVRPGLYAVGWVKRGAVGTIGTNKNDSLEVAERVVAEFSGDAKPGLKAIDDHLARRGVRVVSYPEWQIIDRLEVAAAPDKAPRRKFITPDEMLAALEKTQAAE